MYQSHKRFLGNASTDVNCIFRDVAREFLRLGVGGGWRPPKADESGSFAQGEACLA
jgi:hypothetical protein